MVNIGSSYNYGTEDHAEFLCVVSKECPVDNGHTESTDRAKVRHNLLFDQPRNQMKWIVSAVECFALSKS